MNEVLYPMAVIAVVAIVTWILRAFPFLLFCYGCCFTNHSQEYVSIDYSRNDLLHDTDPYCLGCCVNMLLHKG